MKFIPNWQRILSMFFFFYFFLSQSVDFADYEPSAIIESQVEENGGFQPTTSSTKPCEQLDDDSAVSSPTINCDPIALVSQSPFFAAQKGSKSSPPSLKSIIKYPQQQQQPTPVEPVIQHQQSIEFELIQPETRTELDCEVVFTSERIQEPEITKESQPNVITTANINMSKDNSNPAIAINGNGTEDLFDPWCDPNNPRIVQFQDISAAAFKIKSGIMMTPCTRSHLSNLTGTQIFFKKDFLQYTGSFKVKIYIGIFLRFMFKLAFEK